MKRVFICSPLRGADGQPSEANIVLARRLMRAVFDAGHAPFVPHLLYPQVLTESPEDLAVAFGANFKFLYACEEVWIFARTREQCSGGMKLETDDVLKSQSLLPHQNWPELLWMPPAFETIAKELER